MLYQINYFKIKSSSFILVSPKIPSRKMGLTLWSNWHTLPLYAKQLVGYWTTLLNSQIHKYNNKHLTFITISNQETDKFLNQRHTQLYRLFTLQISINNSFYWVPVLISNLKLWFSQHLHNKKSVTQKHTHLVEVTQDHKEMSHFSFT
jgi:hypothetical protein